MQVWQGFCIAKPQTINDLKANPIRSTLPHFLRIVRILRCPIVLSHLREMDKFNTQYSVRGRILVSGSRCILRL